MAIARGVGHVRRRYGQRGGGQYATQNARRVEQPQRRGQAEQHLRGHVARDTDQDQRPAANAI